MNLKAQNLLPNGSFEEHSTIPDAIGQINFCNHWFSATEGSPDYFSAATTYQNISIPQNGWGYQETQEGNFYVGIYTYNRNGSFAVEYIETKLTEPLIGQKCYSVSFFVSLADSASVYTVNNIGAYFSNTIIDVDSARRLTEFTPQIINSSSNQLTGKVGWTKISGYFLAQGGEEYITIGNFNLPENDDTMQVTGFSSDWAFNKSGYIYIDSVTVKLCGATGIEEIEASQISIYPNPATTNLTINTSNLQNIQVELFDISGRKLLQQNAVNSQQTLDVSSLNNGVYIAVITANNKVVKREKVILSR